ncbi:putative leader peptide [Streptomyces sp. NPDC007088]
MQARPSARCDGREPRCGGSFACCVVRRHVDLLRVSSALCPGTPSRH